MSSTAHIAAYQKGQKAFEDGVPREECPYDSRQSTSGGFPTGARGFAHAWFRGWDDAEKQNGRRDCHHEA